jgi:hypothetical protein
MAELFNARKIRRRRRRSLKRQRLRRRQKSRQQCMQMKRDSKMAKKVNKLIWKKGTCNNQWTNLAKSERRRGKLW